MTVQQFEALTAEMPYVARGIFFSELYLFTVQCLQAGVRQVIESGVRNGLSTRVLRAVWPRCVQSVDMKPFRCPVDLRDEIIYGDGRDLVVGLARAHVSSSVAVLLDGPKGVKGDTLRTNLWQWPHVKVVAQHDSVRGRSETIHSWDETFRRDVGDALDARIPSDVRDRYVHGCPGLGIWVRA